MCLFHVHIMCSRASRPNAKKNKKNKKKNNNNNFLLNNYNVLEWPVNFENQYLVASKIRRNARTSAVILRWYFKVGEYWECHKDT